MNVPSKLAVCVTAILLSQSAGFAADMPMVYAPAPVPEFSGWYLRGDIGMSNQQVKTLTNPLDATADTFNYVSKGFDSGVTYGVGLGYRINDWARIDATGEYRGKTNFRSLQLYTFGGGFGVDDYYGSKSEWLFLTNFYVDLGTWWCLTPFVGAGIGASRNTIHDFRDINVPTGGVAYAPDASKWNFAWAAHAGVSYAVSPNLTLELSYRYVNLGDATSGDLTTYTGVNNVNNPTEFRKITSNDVRFGMRWYPQ